MQVGIDDQVNDPNWVSYSVPEDKHKLSVASSTESVSNSISHYFLEIVAHLINLITPLLTVT